MSHWLRLTPVRGTPFMTVLPVPYIPPQITKYTGQTAPAGLVILANRTANPATPEGMDGENVLPDKINPYSGIYDANGRLPVVPDVGLTFIARV